MNHLIEKVLIYLREVDCIVQGVAAPASSASFLGDDPEFKKHIKRNQTCRQAWDWIEELQDDIAHGLETSNGILIDDAKRLFPMKSVEFLVSSGMPFDGAIVRINPK